VPTNRTGNADLTAAKRAKNDEFYTQLPDIENELRHYTKHFKGKTVLCNCDDPYESNFFKYFAMNFNHLGLKKLIAIGYKESPIVGQQLSMADVIGMPPVAAKKGLPYKVEIVEVTDINKDGAIDLLDVELLLKNKKNVITLLEGDGDFRSEESIEALKEADIVVTNPPFSLFREYVAQLIEYKKKFIIIGSKNAITYREIFPLLKNGEMWLGVGFNAGNAYFLVHDTNREWASGVFNPKTGLVKFRNVGWFTNLDHKKRHERITPHKRYNPEEYPKYDNYDAIEVSKIADIPYDYDGIMGVPITFMDKFNPDQFEILGITAGRQEFDKIAWPTKRYDNPIQVNKDGSTTNGSKANTRATILLNEVPHNSIYYTASNADKPFKIMYARILIKRRPENDN